MVCMIYFIVADDSVSMPTLAGTMFQTTTQHNQWHQDERQQRQVGDWTDVVPSHS